MNASMPYRSVCVREKVRRAHCVSRRWISPGTQIGFRCRSAGKTIIELLVVMAIIATLLGLLVPAAFQVLKAANKLK